MNFGIPQFIYKRILPTLVAFSCVACAFDHEKEADTLQVAAENEIAKANYDEAETLLNKASAEADQSGEWFQKPRVLNDQANLAILQKKPQDAEKFARTAIGLFEEKKKNGSSTSQKRTLLETEAKSALILAEALTAQKKAHEAVDMLEKVKNELTNASADILTQNKVIERWLQARKEAGMPVDSEAAMEALGDSHLEITELKMSATDLDKVGRYLDSIKLLKKIIELNKQGIDKNPTFDARTNIARLAFFLRDTQLNHKMLVECQKDYDNPAVRQKIRPRLLGNFWVAKTFSNPSDLNARKQVKSLSAKQKFDSLAWGGSMITGYRDPKRHCSLNERLWAADSAVALYDDTMPEGFPSYARLISSLFTDPPFRKGGLEWFDKHIKDLPRDSVLRESLTVVRSELAATIAQSKSNK